MEEFEKVERLVEKAHVSYEDAKKALEESGGDMLDAMIYLEKEGKVKAPEQSSFNTDSSSSDRYGNVADAVNRSEGSKCKSFFKSLGEICGKIIRYTSENYLSIKKDEEQVLKLPLWIVIILLLVGWEILLIVMLISLFLGCRYKIVGKDDTKGVNDILDQAADLAGKAKEKFAEQTENSTDGNGTQF